MRVAEAAARARRRAGRGLPAFVRSLAAKAFLATGAPRWALPEWEYVPEGWARADADRRLTGWGVGAVVDAYRRKRPEVLEALRGTGPLSFSTSSLRPTDRHSLRDHNAAISFGYVLALAARGRDRVSVLDWGGGIGLHYRLGSTLVPALELDYHVKEVPQVCAAGRELEPAVTFHEDESCLDRRYDLVMASSSLQYDELWQASLSKLAAATSTYLFLTRVPVVFHAASYVVRHRASVSRVDAEFLSWVVNRDELVERAELAGAALVREFLIAPRATIPLVPEPQELRAFLFTTAPVACDS